MATIGLVAMMAGVAYGQRMPEPAEPYEDWMETACVMQPWSLGRVRAMVEDREEWIPRLKSWGVDTVIFIPGPGDINPSYPPEVLRAAADDYHEAGMQVLMYWSIMHVGHHDTWHTVAGQKPEWWQRDAEGGVVTVYGDRWLCPNTGALEHCIDLGIELAREIDADGIMLDNNEFYWTDVGATGYCEGCQEAFRAHVREKVGDEALREMGLEPEAVRCPLPDEALWGEWVDWRYVAWREANAQFRRRMREALPGTMLTANTQYKYTWILAVHEQIHGEDVLFSESKNQLAREMSCKLAYGHAIADGKPVWNYLGTWQSDDLNRLGEKDVILDALSTTLAWNCPPWIVGYGLIFQAPAHWWVQGWYVVPESARWLRDEEAGPDGSAAVALSSPDEMARMSISHQPFLEIEAGQQFDFSIRYRTEDVEGGGPRVRLTFVDAAHQPPAGEPHVFFAEGEGGTHGWQEMTLEGIVAPEGAEVVNVEPFLWHASGTVWWDDVRLISEGENLVRNPDFEMSVGEIDAEKRDALVQGLQLRREHEDLFRGAVRWADVGVLLSRHSVDFAEVYNRFPRPTLNALFDAHIPFQILREQQLDEEHLSRIRVLVVPQASCLSDEYLEALAEWTREGGRLIVTGATGLLTEYAQPRETDPLAELLGHSREALAQEQSVGEGSALWLPHEDANRDVPEGLVAAIRAMDGGRTVRVTEGGAGVDVVSWAQPEQRRVLLHLDRHEAGAREPMALRAEIPEGWGMPERVRVLDLGGEQREVEFTCAEEEVAFTVDAPEWYGLVVVEY
jgi:hypothetical protein